MNTHTDAAALEAALEAWRASAPLRQRRRRYKDYTYGRQWNDPIRLDSHRVVSEREAAEAAGSRPMTNNMIRQLVKCITGNFRSRLEAAGGDSTMTAETAARNSSTELDCRMLEEFLISGCAIQRVVTERRMAGEGVWIDNVSPARFFVNHFTDPRGLDIELVGMLHDLSLREVQIRFSHGSPTRAVDIERIYAGVHNSPHALPSLGDEVSSEFFDAPPGRCRLIEVWTLESRTLVKCHDPLSGELFLFPAAERGRADDLNRRREEARQPTLEMQPHLTTRWHCRLYAPTGDIIDEFDSPYRHGCHPFVVKFYPLTDGEIHSFVEDIIDQQRYVNRIITLIDHILSTSAKGVLLFPKERKPKEISWEEVSAAWTRPSGVIPLESRSGVETPQQITGSGEPVGAYRLLELQMGLFQQISGVNDAIQGRLSGGAASSAALYDAQVNTATLAILDLIETFNDFRHNRDRLVNTA